MTRYIRITVSLTLIYLMVVSPVYAGWVDDWLDQHTSASSGYYEGQQRGYYTLGSFSGRMHTGAAYPISIAPPRIKAGCGGIDVFMGSMSFMNFDYLVQKMQTIMQNAPIVAFELGLSVLSEKMKNTINSVEDFLNALNNIQINDCKATKAVVAEIHDRITGDKLGEPTISELITSGTSELWKKGVDVINSAKGDISQITSTNNEPAVKNITKGCPDDIKQIFDDGSVLENIGTKMNIPALYTDLIRGLAGDINIKNQDGLPVGEVIGKCEENNVFNIENFLTGDVYKKDTAGNCAKITDLNANIRNYVETKMSSVVNNIMLRANPSPDDAAFLNSVPLPVYVSLKDAVGTGQESAIEALLVEAVTKAYIYRMLSDLYTVLLNILEKGVHTVSIVRGAKGGEDANTCRIEIYTDEFQDKIQTMKEYTYKLNDVAREAYAKSAEEINNIYTLVQKLKETGDVIHIIVASRFGEEIASHVGVGSSAKE